MLSPMLTLVSLNPRVSVCQAPEDVVDGLTCGSSVRWGSEGSVSWMRNELVGLSEVEHAGALERL